MVTEKTKIDCEGKLPFGGRDFRCWKKTGHGEVDLKAAMEQSCDVYFYQLGLDLGVDTIHYYSKLFGLGEATGIDLPGEGSGLVPSKAWKRRARGQPWYSGETLNVSIGQGYLLTTPLQLAAMTAAVAHPAALRLKPGMVSRVETPEGEVVKTVEPEVLGVLPFKEAHLSFVRKALLEVVYGELGTGKRSAVEGWQVAGKTGTAQVVSLKEDEEGLDAEEIAWRHRDHALFVAYAPFEDPRVAVAVVVDHGGHGGVGAAPVAGAVIARYKELLEEREQAQEGAL